MRSRGDVVRIGPQIEVPGDELAAIIDLDRLGIADTATYSLERLDDILAAIGEARIDRWAIAGMRVDNGQDTELLAGRELVMDKIHGPHIVRSDDLLAILPELGLDPSLGVLVPEL